MHEEGIAFLQSLGDTPIAIVAVAGPARCGKSFFINNVAQVPQVTDDEVAAVVGADGAVVPGAGSAALPLAPKGFPVGSGVEGVTHGLWLHSQVGLTLPLLVNGGRGCGVTH